MDASDPTNPTLERGKDSPNPGHPKPGCCLPKEREKEKEGIKRPSEVRFGPLLYESLSKT